jgi:hypothetical protein
MIQAIGATPEKSLARASQKWQRSQMKIFFVLRPSRPLQKRVANRLLEWRQLVGAILVVFEIV